MNGTLKYKKGNLLDMLDMFDVVLQGNNCFHTHGAGIAGVFASKYPQVPEADRMQTVYGDRNKLGTYSKAGLAGGDWVTIASIIENQLRGEDVTVVQL